MKTRQGLAGGGKGGRRGAGFDGRGTSGARGTCSEDSAGGRSGRRDGNKGLGRGRHNTVRHGTRLHFGSDSGRRNRQRGRSRWEARRPSGRRGGTGRRTLLALGSGTLEWGGPWPVGEVPQEVEDVEESWH